MSDARQSPIPQDRVNENVDQAQRAHDSKLDKRTMDRHLADQGVDDRPGTDDAARPDVPAADNGPAEGGD